MSGLAALEAQAAAEITTFDYPSKEWTIPISNNLDVAIVGYGHVGLMLALALRRERISRIVICRTPLDRMGVYPALTEKRRLPRLDFAGRELSAPSLGIPAWLASCDLVPGELFGAALARQWLAYLDWLARQIGIDITEESVPPATARHTAVAWSCAGVSNGCMAADLSTDTVKGAGVAIQGDDAAAHDLALTALELGAAWVTLRRTADVAMPEGLLESHDVVHGFPLLPPEQQAALRAAARRITVPPPALWRRRLADDARVRRDAPTPDVTLVPGDPMMPLVPSDATVGADLSVVGRPSRFVLSPAASGSTSPVLHPLSLARFGVPIVNAAISRAIFLAEADTLFRDFLAFETAEGLGGRLLSDS